MCSRFFSNQSKSKSSNRCLALRSGRLSPLLAAALLAAWVLPSLAADQTVAPDRDVQWGELPAAVSRADVLEAIEAMRPIDPALVSKVTEIPATPILNFLHFRLIMTLSDEPALTIDQLLRVGEVDRALKVADRLPPKSAKPPGLVIAIAEASLARGRDDAACSDIKRLVQDRSPLSPEQDIRALQLTVLCAVLTKDKTAAKSGSALLTERKAGTPAILAALSMLADGNTPEPWKPFPLGVVDARILALAGIEPNGAALAVATPSGLSAIVATSEFSSEARVTAAETAARQGHFHPVLLAAAYSKAEADPSGLANPLATSLDGAAKRALLFQAIRAEGDDSKRAILIRALVEDARSDGLAAAVSATVTEEILRTPLHRSNAWFAATAAEGLSCDGKYSDAAEWAIIGAAAVRPEKGSELLGWLLLNNIGDPNGDADRVSAMKLAEDLQTAGLLSDPLLHRLVTVLDALAYDTPVLLREAAAKAPQPTGGRLPPTGLLRDLKAKSRANAVPESLSLVLQAFGAERADAVNLMTLGDAIQALRAVGFEKEARRLGFEALLPDWPRQAGG